MPKKYKQRSLLTKPTSGAPSNLSLSNSSNSVQDESPKKTVNDLIREARRGNGAEAQQNVSVPASIPPSLRAVLDMPPPPPPPPPRVGVRGPTRTRRIPGPPPPKSWLTNSIHAPSELQNATWSRGHEKVRVQNQRSTLPEGSFPSQTSLQHLLLRQLARDWSWHAECGHEYLAELPNGIKQTLLSYISVYSDSRGPDPLRLLFPKDLAVDELDEVRRLDLGNAIGGWTTTKGIIRKLESSTKQKLGVQHISDSANSIPDTWDEDGTLQSIPTAPDIANGLRFRNLKHLCLAVSPGTAGPTASWTDLLASASKFSTITSLSLAFWPLPTYTPNASLGRTKIGSSGATPSVLFGGTNFYTAFDNDWREAAGILKTLSRSMYCLKWLDLTGCGDWFSALTWRPLEEDSIGGVGPDWNGSWRSIEHLVLDVGWSPGPEPSEHSAIESDIEREADGANDNLELTPSRVSERLSQLSALRLGTTAPIEFDQPEAWNVEFEREKYYYRKEVEKYTAIIDRAKGVARELRSLRKRDGGKWLNIDLGSV